MIKTRSHIPSQNVLQQGVVLLEALIAILIFSLGILGVVGLQAVMIKNSADARFRSDASVIAQQRIGQLWADPSNAALLETSPGTDISTLLPGGRRITTQKSTYTNPNGTISREFLVTINWTPPSDTTGVETHTYAMMARVDP
jgi:type IV pilus assembly protein PilV